MMGKRPPVHWISGYWFATAVYFLAGMAWICATDLILLRETGGFRDFLFNVAKGSAFVVTTSVILFLVLRRESRIQKAYRSELERSRSRYKALFDLSRTPLLVIDPKDGRILDANAEACRFYSYDASELRAMHLGDFTGQSREAMTERLEAIAHGTVVRFTASHRLKHGEVREVEVHAGPIRVARRIVILQMIIDRTVRREAEREKEVAHALLESVSKAAPDGVLITDTAGRWLRWNERLLSLWNVDEAYARKRAAEPHRRDLFDVLTSQLTDPEDFFTRTMSSYSNSEARFKDTVRFIDGRRYERHGMPIIVAGSVFGRAWYYHDVTESEHSRSQLRAAVEQLKAIVDSAPLAIVTLDRDGHVTSWSKGAEDIFGWSSDEVMGRKLPFVQPSREAEFRRFADEVLSGNSLRSVRIIRQRRTGEEIAVSLNAVPLRDAAGEPVAILGLLEDLTPREEAERRLLQLATRDPLTDLPNRTSFREELSRALLEADRSNEKFAVHFLDLDNFKIINDSLGHEVGDQLLQAVADGVRVLIRPDDFLARLGGDEFALLQRHLSDLTEVESFAKRLLDFFERPLSVGGHDLAVSASIGVACHPEDGSSPEQLLKNADMAMYEAKRRGRQTWATFTTALEEVARDRQEIEAALRQAIDRNEFILHYQPQIDLKTGAVIAVEALIRWEHPTRGRIQPGLFIGIAESSGLIRRIGTWVIEELCRRAVEHNQPHLRYAANLSFAQFADPALADTVESILRTTQMNAAQLELELTESMLASDSEKAIQLVDHLNGLGIQLAIDDFGTGYSSLSYLRKFKVSRLKIDRSFIKDLPGDSSAAAIVHASIALAHSLGLAVLAEGVEDETQQTFLLQAGCDEAQGFHYAVPMTWDEFTAWCETRRHGE